MNTIKYTQALAYFSSLWGCLGPTGCKRSDPSDSASNQNDITDNTNFDENGNNATNIEQSDRRSGPPTRQETGTEGESDSGPDSQPDLQNDTRPSPMHQLGLQQRTPRADSGSLF